MSAYRSRYTGREIDQMLASIDNKIDLSYIINDWTGGTQLAASAELAKNLNERLLKFSDPNYIEELITSIPGSLIFTAEDKDKLDRLAGFFQGSFINAATRNLAVSTIGFSGGELTFLIDDGSGTNTQELSYWDTSTSTWKKARFLPDPATAATRYVAGGTIIGVTFDKTKFGAGKYVIKGESDAHIKIVEMLAAVKGVDTFWTVQGEIGNGNNLFSVAGMSIAGDLVRINLLITPNVTIRMYRVAEF
jgi:hypothetical protein